VSNVADSPPYIVLAEDNAADACLVREVLEDRAVTCALHVLSDGEAAIEFIGRIDRTPTLECPRLFLLDFYLPRRNGEEVLRFLRSSERCRLTPVVIMTSAAVVFFHENRPQNAGLYYFRKPMTLAEYLTLGDVIWNIIGSCDEPLAPHGGHYQES
jgi:CheY-like chemotaxis protein